MRIPPWLDAERARTVEIYTDAVHERCSCEWTESKLTPEHGRFKLVLRSRGCPIHGAAGHI